jgi:riboflavin kinase/FMN adenylyltransferase
MELVRTLARVQASPRPCILAVGRFDGVHRGHQRVLHRLCDVADQLRGDAVVALRATPSLEPALTTLRQRLALLADHGVERAILLGRRDPNQAGDVAGRLTAAVVVAGASVADARCPVERVEQVASEGVAVSAAMVRKQLATGDLAAAQRVLGRRAAVEGRVVHGFHRGAPLGIPTANLRVQRLVLPPDGVYAVRGRVRDQTLDGVANIGHNPTFGNLARSVETHLLDFAADIYGARLEIAFVARLRGELKFSDVEALVGQIRADIAAARKVFAAHGDGV